MLIDSPRLTSADREHWARMAKYDAQLAKGADLDRATALAQSRIREFAAHGPCHVACSWGRDSVTIAHLAHDMGLPVIWAVIGPDRQWQHKRRIDNPDCPAVRDSYLTHWPAPGYAEMRFGVRRVGGKAVEEWPATEAEKAAFGEGHPITGIRSDESPNRSISMITHGHTTTRTCRPIIDWPSRLVWAYAARHDLPVHPAYAMTFGGVLQRDKIRVHSLGGSLGRGAGRWEWENAYYPEVLDVRARTEPW